MTSGSKRERDYDSEDNYEISGDDDEAADITELIGLADDAELSVEELRKKYYGGDDDAHAAKKGENKQASVKRSKIVDEDDDDG